MVRRTGARVRMRLSCEVEIVNRLLAAQNLKKASRTCRAQISVGKKPAPNAARCGSQLYLMVCTAKDRNGMKYLIKNNVSQIFVKFVMEGKATIRFKEPEQDLCLSKADPIQLKSLLSIVRSATRGEDLDKITLSSLAPASTKQVEKPRSEMTITSRKEYPVTSRFPSSLESLTIHTCGMKRLDPRILHLSKLHTLDLSYNSLSSLPEDWGTVQGLCRLTVTYNQLGGVPPGLWKSKLCQTLVMLDLRKNSIQDLPLQLCELQQLSVLKLDHNQISTLPATIGKMLKLRELTFSNNQVKRLPAGFVKLRLDSLDVSENPFEEDRDGVMGEDQLTFPSLLECVARAIRKYRIPYTEEDLFPQLFHYLSAARQCWCNNYCFRCSARYLQHVNLRHLVYNSFSSSPGVETVLVEGFLCSQNCLQRFQRNPRAYWRS